MQPNRLRLDCPSLLIGLLSSCALLFVANAGCAPGTFSPTGTHCRPCRELAQPFCKSLPTPCQTEPPCDPVTGVFTSLCWVNKPDGAACDASKYGNQPVTDATAYVCKTGECLAVGDDASADETVTNVVVEGKSPNKCRGLRGERRPCHKPPVKKTCSAGSGGKPCRRCKKGTFSRGGSLAECKNCSSMPQNFCKDAGGPCYRYPKCDATTGLFLKKCWDTVPDDTPCNPDSKLHGELPPLADHVCVTVMDVNTNKASVLCGRKVTEDLN